MPLSALPPAFDAALSGLLPGGPWELAVGVSGGADSTALALLAQGFTRRHGGRVRAFIVDHGLREGSAAEAGLTRARLAARGVAAEILTLSGLPTGAGLQAAARAARHEALAAAACAAGCVFLLLGHHADDQAETVAMRAERGEAGLEGMSRWSARRQVVVLRPLLGFGRQALRDWLGARGMAWVEDPSNAMARFERVRVRQAGTGKAARGGDERAAREARDAEFLARHVAMRPEGFALLEADAMPDTALGALLRALGGAAYAPRREALARLAARLGPATLGGVRILPAGRLGPGWLCVREAAACAPPVAARPGRRWDGRFLYEGTPGGWLGALGGEAGKFRRHGGLPAAVLAVMPAWRDEDGGIMFPAPARFCPPQPLTSRPFWA
ncbi:tRNA lysidine(34) synthetase TilS [Acidocella sp.]|uniref:tRNA lysidine(34) synthetase TilS n=1 Tax=Acidocella sp. TaxID=50710 RepID=UPI00262E17E5|nr:tRNA lysidine(34) synthetase TilS [Acidocella sp.]